MAMIPRRVVGDAKRWKAMSHPLRREMLAHLDERGPATSTTIAEALGENTGTTSYHLRVLADAGIIEEVPGRAGGRERWWRTFPVDLREPDYDSLSDDERAALDEWRAGQIPGELELVNRFIRDVRQHGRWARASRQAATTPSGISRRCMTSTSRSCISTATPPRTPRRGRGPCSCGCSTSPTSPPPGEPATGEPAARGARHRQARRG